MSPEPERFSAYKINIIYEMVVAHLVVAHFGTEEAQFCAPIDMYNSIVGWPGMVLRYCYIIA